MPSSDIPAGCILLIIATFAGAVVSALGALFGI